MDGCADVGGCFEGPVLLFEAVSKSKHPGGIILFFLGVFLFIGVLAYVDQVEPAPPPPPPPTLKERLNAAKEQAAENAKQKLHDVMHPGIDSPDPTPVAPVTTKTNRWGKAKDWLRNKLNEDYNERHSEDK